MVCGRRVSESRSLPGLALCVPITSNDRPAQVAVIATLLPTVVHRSAGAGGSAFLVEPVQRAVGVLHQRLDGAAGRRGAGAGGAGGLVAVVLVEPVALVGRAYCVKAWALVAAVVEALVEPVAVLRTGWRRSSRRWGRCSP